MIEQLIINNFQPHESLTIDFERITCITGPSDTGKTAIFRILKWIATNRPGGDSFITHGKDSVSGILKLDGRVITRKRAKGENLYSLDRKEFHAFGTDVPEEIQTLLNLSEVNFQNQHDPSFWFFKTPGEVSKELNKIIDLSLMDRTLTNLASQLRTNKTRLVISQERLAQSQKDKDSLEWVVDASTSLDVIERKKEGIDSKASSVSTMTLSLESGRLLALDVQNGSKAKLDGLKLVSQTDRVQELSDKVEGMEDLCREISTAREEIQKTKKSLTLAEKELKSIQVGNCPVCGREFK